MSDLKPCPFCGSTHIIRESTMSSKEDGLRYMRCINCSASGRHIHFSHSTSSEDAWNTRPFEDALIAERDNLQARLDIAKEALENIYTRANDFNKDVLVKMAVKVLQRLEEK